MDLIDGRLAHVRIEIVTATFVASGRPRGINDLERFLENLNNPAISRQIELDDAAVRPLYRAQGAVELDAPMLVRRDEIIFANFEGPSFSADFIRRPARDVPVVLMASPFQIAGDMSMSPDADSTETLRSAMQRFFVVRGALVFDAEGNNLGEGDHIIVNGARVQMTSATRRYISAAPKPVQQRLSIVDAPDAGPARRAA